MIGLPGTLLVVAPHADDEVLGAGGLIYRVNNAGGTVLVLILNPQLGEWAGRMDEARAGLNVLGGGDLHVACYSGQYRFLDQVPHHEIVDSIESSIQAVRPDWLLMPDGDGMDDHQDHRIASHACLTACRPSGGTGQWRPPVVAAYEHMADAWPPRPRAEPNLIVSLSQEDVYAKVLAMREHKSQYRAYPSERSAEAIEGFAALRGGQHGVGHAEAFVQLRGVVL